MDATSPPGAARLLRNVVLVAGLLLTGCATPAPLTGPPPAAPAEVLAATARQAASSRAAAPPARLRIPRIAVDTPVIGLGLRPDGTLEVPADGTVAGWFTGSPAPGGLGPAVVAAHVDWDRRPGVFVDLDDLRPGDEVEVDGQDGTTARFVVLAVEQYAKSRFPADRVYGDIDHAGLRLITCGGEFDRSARSYRDNVVVYAGLVGDAPASPR